MNRRDVAVGLAGVFGGSVSAAHAQDGCPIIPTNLADLLIMSREHVAALSDGHSAWGFGREQTWSVDLDRSLIEWRFPDRVVSAPAQLIATWASDLGTLRWGWDHPAAPPGTAVAAQQVRDFAHAHAIAELRVVEPSCSSE